MDDLLLIRNEKSVGCYFTKSSTEAYQKYNWSKATAICCDANGNIVLSNETLNYVAAREFCTHQNSSLWNGEQEVG